jgi:hypothetical protein
MTAVTESPVFGDELELLDPSVARFEEDEEDGLREGEEDLGRRGRRLGRRTTTTGTTTTRTTGTTTTRRTGTTRTTRRDGEGRRRARPPFYAGDPPTERDGTRGTNSAGG